MPRQYCQPTQECWNNVKADLPNFRGKINSGGNSTSCLGLPKVVYFNDPSAHEWKTMPYNGLTPRPTDCQVKSD